MCTKMKQTHSINHKRFIIIVDCIKVIVKNLIMLMNSLKLIQIFFEIKKKLEKIKLDNWTIMTKKKFLNIFFTFLDITNDRQTSVTDKDHPADISSPFIISNIAVLKHAIEQRANTNSNRHAHSGKFFWPLRPLRSNEMVDEGKKMF